ncbi:hypothetical protein P3S67_028216 [Capsicum chacoense]
MTTGIASYKTIPGPELSDEDEDAEDVLKEDSLEEVSMTEEQKSAVGHKENIKVRENEISCGLNSGAKLDVRLVQVEDRLEKMEAHSEKLETLLVDMDEKLNYIVKIKGAKVSRDVKCPAKYMSTSWTGNGRPKRRDRIAEIIRQSWKHQRLGRGDKAVVHPVASQRDCVENDQNMDSTSQMENADGTNWQEETYQKIKSMMEKYLPELNALYQKIASKVQQHDAIPQRPQNEQIEKLKRFKAVLERIVIFLQLNKHDIQLTHKEKLCSVERHIGFFLSKPTSPPLQGQLPQSPMQLQQPQSLDVQTNPPMQPQLHQAPSSQAQSTGALQTATLDSDSTSQTGNADGADWQEELYQEIKTMREKNLPELNALYQKIASKVQQHDAIPQRPQNEQIEKLKRFKAVLERIVIFLQLNKHDIQLTHKEKLCSVERHIGFFLSKPTSPPLQGQLPQSSMQLQQPQSLDVQTNPPMQPQLHQALSSQAQSTGAHQTAMLESGGQDTASKSD